MSEISYSDGVSIESEIAAALANEPKADSLSRIAAPRYGEWPVRYHLSPERGNLLRPFSFEGLDVVEFGCGLGAVSRIVAESCKSLFLIEGTQSRFDGASARLKDLKNWSGVVSNFADVKPAATYDVALCIGVLEYAEMFMTPPADFAGDVFQWALHCMTRWLKPGGVLIVAIENRIGLKYWTGCSEDHTSFRFDGVVGYREGKSPRTFSHKELINRLAKAGLGTTETYYPFPDYKIPHAIVRAPMAGQYPEAAASLAASRPFQDYQREKRPLVSDPLALKELAQAGLFADFANSFLFLATNGGEGETLKCLTSGHENTLAWHYNVNRRRPTITRFVKEQDGARVEKTELVSGKAKTKYDSLRWFSVNEPLTNEPSLRLKFLRQAFFGEREKFLALWKSFATHTIDTWGKVSETDTVLDGKAVDALLTNAVLDGRSRRFLFFDQEWAATEPLSRSWWALRNALSFGADAATLGQIGFTSLAEVYVTFCEEIGVVPSLPADLEKEIQLQVEVTGLSAALLRKGVEELLYRSIPRLSWREAEPLSPSIKKSAKDLGEALRVRANREWEKREGLRGRLLGAIGLAPKGSSSPHDASAE